MTSHAPGCGGDPCTCIPFHDSDSLSKELGVYSHVFVIGVVIFIVELVGSIESESLALLSDSGHVFIDFVVTGSAYLIVSREVRRGQRSKSLRTFGTFLQVALLFVVAFSIVAEAMERLREPRQIDFMLLTIFSLVGLFGNMIQLRFSGEAHTRLHQGIKVHIISDFASSFLAVLSGPLVAFSGIPQVDTFASFAIAGCIVLFGIPAILWKKH